METIKQKQKYQPLIYIITALLYTVRGSLFEGVMSNMITKGLFVLFFALSIYYFIKANQLNDKNRVCRYLNVLVVLVLIYGGVFAMTGTDNTWERQTTPFFFFYSYLESILPVYAFYYFGKKGWIDDTWFKNLLFLFILFVVYYYIDKRSITMALQDDTEEITNNASYMVLSLFPAFAFYKKRPLYFYTLILLASLLIISGGKRGAIVLGALCLAYSLIKVSQGIKNWQKIIVFASFAVVVYITWKYTGEMLQNNDRFNDRMMELAEGSVSNREDLYPIYFSFFLDSSASQFIFGHGAVATCRYLGLMAHNDWLEMLINMGLIGFFSLLAYWISVFVLWIKNYSCIKEEVVMAMGMFVIIYFGRTFFSMSIMDMSILATSVFGYCLSVFDTNGIKKTMSLENK